jgi:hypothetical protein
MRNYEKTILKQFAKKYIRDNENIITKLGEINQEYLEVFPIIKEVTDQIIEEKRAEFETKYNELEAEYSKGKHKFSLNEFLELKIKLKKIRGIYFNMDKNQKELSDLLDID